MLYDYSTTTAQTVGAVVDDAIEAADAAVAAIVAPGAARTWEATMAPLDEINASLTEAYGRGPFMARVHPEVEVRDAATEAEEKIIKWSSDLTFRRDLYEAIEEYAATPEAAALEGERARFLEFTRRDFRRAGHALTEEERNRVQEIRTRLVELGVAFGRNIDEYQDGMDLTREQLAGTDESYIDGLSPGETEGTYRVSLDYPDYYPFMDEADDRDLRRQMQFKFYNKAAEQNESLLEETVALRADLAAIFGLPSWAHYSMEEKMAKAPEAVESFFADLVPPLEKMAAAEMDDLRERLGEDTVEGWDYRYLHTAIRKERYGIDQNAVAAYFPLERVLDGMFEITGEVLGLTYEPVEGVATWHPDVSVHKIIDTASGRHLATFYADLFPREGKFGHAAAFDLVTYRRTGDDIQVPVTAIAANFTKPTADAPSLLKHDEVVTLFHEFGHVLHNSLGHTEIARFAGFNTEWDFVEAPSQIMEHWCWTPSVLQRFARHHETGEPIPADLVEQLAEARDLHVALFMLRQISFGLLDMALHGPGKEKDLHEITRVTSEVAAFPFHEGTFYPASFGHLFGYDAGYYGYLWSKVFGDDMFSRFEEEGVLDPRVGMAYRQKVLEPGGSRDAGDLLRDFLGREPNQEAFLRQLGIA